MGARKGGTGFLVAFLAPAGLTYLALVVWPLVNALWLSGFRWSGLSRHKTFIGADNFRELVADPVFWRSLTNTLILVVACVAFLIGAGLALASAVRGNSRSARLLRSVYLFPHVVSLVVVAILWTFVLNPQMGLVNSALRAAGLHSWERAWLGDPHFALPSVALAFCWAAFGFYAMLFAAGIEAIPAEVNEAASLDGAVGFRQFASVTWPLLWSIKRVAVVYGIVNVVNIFALVLLMTQGGDPDRATETVLTYLYEQGFEVSKFGYASAIAVANFGVVMALALGVLFVFRRDPSGAR